VPSGAVITQQDQADRLADAQPEDLAFVKELTTVNQALRAGYSQPSQGTTRRTATTDDRDRPPLTSIAQDNGTTRTMQPQRLTTDIVQQVRQLLNQGYRIGTEHADARRYRSNVWQTCSPLQSTREGDVLTALEACLEEHTGEYVRMFGIDPAVKRRVATTTIQRPDGKPVDVQSRSVPSAGGSVQSTGGGSRAASSGAGQAGGDLLHHVRNWLSQGYRIGLEHADTRRFRSNVWQSCSPVQANNEREVMSALQNCVNEHQGEYVRMFGIDPVAKRRISPITIQRPDGSAKVEVGGNTSPTQSSYSNGASASPAAPSGQLSAEAVQRVRGLLSQGLKIGTEHADQRRFRSNVWQTCSPIEATREGEVVAALSACVREHAGEYVRVFGIDPKAKKRLAPIMIHRPGETVGNGPSVPYRAPSQSFSASTAAPSHNGNSHNGHQALSDDIVQQVRQLIGQGYRISLEHADVRRYRSGAWQSGGVLEGQNPSAVLSALESGLASHSGEYVRLVGIDPQAKRRVLETTIQRP